MKEINKLIRQFITTARALKKSDKNMEKTTYSLNFKLLVLEVLYEGLCHTIFCKKFVSGGTKKSSFLENDIKSL